MDPTSWCDALWKDKRQRCTQESERLQKILLCAAERDSDIAEYLERKRKETAYMKDLIADSKAETISLEAETADCSRRISERKSAITQIKSDNENLELQKKKLLQGFDDFRCNLRRQQESLIIANGYFKRRLKCYIQLDGPNDDTFVVAFFTSEKEVTYDYFVKIKWDAVNNIWTVEDMKPKIACQSAIAKKLARTGDIQGFLYHVRKLYLRHKDKFS